MKKRGSAKSSTKDKPAAASTDTTASTSKTGDKRQLPLDFSRHAVHSNQKKITLSQENATNYASPTTTPASLVADLPAIRVNLVASVERKEPENCESNGAIEAEIVVVSGNVDILSCDDDQNSPGGAMRDDGDDDDTILRSSASSRVDSDGMDDEDDSSMVIKTEQTLDLRELLQIKTEPEEDKKNLDMILPSRFRWKTVYVAAFELALDTVLPEEAFLFTDEEHSLFETYRRLSDDPKHLFVRLFLRNQKYWQRQSKLEFRYREIEDLGPAIQQLITVGLLIDQGAIQDPDEALVMLTMDELKILARRIGIMEKLSGKQRDNALVDKIVDISGPCIKIYPNIMKVFERLHLVFYRTREYSERPALMEAILAKIGQRTFPTYDITRTNTVFRNRNELLKYEAAIKLHFELSEMIESAMGPGRAAVVYVRDGDQASDIGGTNSQRRSNSVKLEGNGADGGDIKANQEKNGPDKERRRLEVIEIYEKVIEQAESVRRAWREYVATETEVSKKSPNYFLLRFSPGWIYTQILRLELRAYAFLKRFEEESILLHELLDQRIYSLGQRGGWYERLALIKSNYAFQKRLGKQEALQVCMMALRDKHVHAVDATLIQARIVRLETELKVPFRDRHDFSYIALRKAQKRILTGERLNTPGTAAPSYASSHSYSYVPNSMGSSHPVTQQRPLWRNIDGSDCSVEELALSYYGTLGYKGYHSENSILATLFGLLFWDILFSPQPGVFETSFQTEPLDLRTDAFFLQRQDMIMKRIEDIARSKIVECIDSSLIQRGAVSTATVKDAATMSEQVADEEDEPLMRKGRAGLRLGQSANQELMDNILFQDEIEQEVRENDEENLKKQQEQQVREELLARKRKECFYLDLLQRHDDLYREKNVYCAGVNWTFAKEELLQIAECIGGAALSEICKILAQEYSKRCSGMPDLCCWDYGRKLVKFVEVKGPGDRLSSKQQIWIDLLTSLAVDIELCIVQVSKDEDTFLKEREALN
ncbi:hypothetical protein BGZ58_000097 [Dissophora ornata]|nr:hypothetical protein BGZ58_000097 [Dissophora ornata]